MPITWKWLDEDKNILIVRFNNSWSLDNYRATEAELFPVMKSQISRFDIITDFSTSTHTVPIGSLYEWLSGVELRDAAFQTWGLTVWIGISSVMQAYLSDGNENSEIVQKHIRTANTVEEAVQLIMNDREQ